MIAMGIGEGMTGRPFLTNFANNLYEQKQAQLKYRQWQEEQKIAQQKADIDMLAKMQGTEISYPDPTTGKLITTRMSGLELPQEITSPVYQRLGVKNPSSLSQPSSGITPPEGFMAVKEGGKTKFVKVSDPKDVASMADSKKKEQMQVEGLRLAAQDTLDTISEIKNGKGNFGVFGDVPSIPGTQRKNWEANVDKLKSQRIIDLMAQMKAVSKTGATGFGQLSEKELKVLQDASTAFQRGLSQKDALKYLNKMESMARKVLTDEKNPMATMSNEELQSIIDNAKAK
jgi:hypothetical protein